MKPQRYIQLIAILYITVFGGCTPSKTPLENSGENNKNPGEKISTMTLSDGSILKAGTKYFGEGNEAYISVLDTNKVSLSPEVPEQLKLSIGDIVLVPYSNNLPFGFYGKVVSIETKASDEIYITESAPLDDVFEELHINSTIEVFENDSVLFDSEGNEYSGSIIDSSIWDQLDNGEYSSIMPESTSGTNTKAGTSYAKTLSIPIHSNFFSGSLILSSTLTAIVDITKGKITNYEFSIWNRSYVTGTLGFEAGGSSDFVLVKERELRLPIGIPIGPVIKLQPIFTFSILGNCSGQIKYGGSLHMGLTENMITFKNGEYAVTSGDAGGCSLSPKFLNCEGFITLEPQIALLFDVWGLKQLGLGFKAAPSVKLGLSGTMEMENKSQIKKDVRASLTTSGSVGVFMYAGKFFNDGVQIEGNYYLNSSTRELDVLDRGKGLKFTSEPGCWSVDGKIDDKTLMAVDDKGISLFMKGEDEPIMSVSMSAETKSSTTFSVPIDAIDYYVCVYNKVGDYSFYGSPINPIIKSFTYMNESWTIHRDEYYRIQSIDISSSRGNHTVFVQYRDNGVEWYDSKSPLGEARMISVLDDSGYLQSNTITWYERGGGSSTSTYTHQDNSISVTSGNYHAFITLDGSGNWTSFKEWNPDWGDAYDYYTFRYLDKPDVFDIDLLRILQFGYFDTIPNMSIKGFHCPSLPASLTLASDLGSETITFDYTFYENGLVKDISAFKGRVSNITYEQ